MTRHVDADRATAMPPPYRRMFRYRCFECGDPSVRDHQLADIVSACHPESVLLTWNDRLDLAYATLVQLSRNGETDLAGFIERFEPETYITAAYFLKGWLANRMPTNEDMAMALACGERWGTFTGAKPVPVPGIDNPLSGWMDGDHHGYSRGRVK